MNDDLVKVLYGLGGLVLGLFVKALVEPFLPKFDRERVRRLLFAKALGAALIELVLVAGACFGLYVLVTLPGPPDRVSILLMIVLVLCAATFFMAMLWHLIWWRLRHVQKVRNETVSGSNKPQ